MLARGFTSEQIARTVALVSDHLYSGNIFPDNLREEGTRKPRARFTVRCHSSKIIGARHSASGRRTVAGCWHAYRDVLIALFDINPSATIITAVARYNGREGFNATYPDTYYHNVGNPYCEVSIGALCDCEGQSAEEGYQHSIWYRMRHDSNAVARHFNQIATRDHEEGYSPDSGTGMLLDELLGVDDRLAAIESFLQEG